MKTHKITIQDVVDAVESALEGDNRHSETFGPKWDAVKNFIPKRYRLKAVMTLADSMDCAWESDLRYSLSGSPIE